MALAVCGVPTLIFKLLLVYYYVITSVCISTVFFCILQGKANKINKINNVIEFMYSEESEDNEEGASGPPSRHIKPLRSKRSKLRNINAVLASFYEARMSKRQKKNSDGNNQRGRKMLVRQTSIK